MALWIGAVVVDSQNPTRLARFWADALGYEMHRSDDSWAWIADPAGGHVRLSFTYEREPKTSSNRLHFDLYAENMEGEVERLTGLGARYKRENREPGNDFVVMQDPEGNEFCVCRK
jgi:hypothetical protein